MTFPLDTVDPGGLQEFSVVFTDRSLNHMSKAFQAAMREIDETLRSVYGADHTAIVPGGGTYAMEAVARSLATGKRAMVIRNGFFSFRWSQIFDAGGIPAAHDVLKARRAGNGVTDPFAPAPIEEVEKKIAADAPEVVFAPHVETASGMILPDDYIARVAAATHAVGGLFVLDCIASGCMWVDMKALGVDVLISAPQKGWSSTPCAGIVMLNDAARAAADAGPVTSFAADLKKWLSITDAYRNGGHAYHATMPTDGLMMFRDAMRETAAMGFDAAKAAQADLGVKVRAVLAARGYRSVAAPGFEAPGVVVSYTADPDIQTGAKFASKGYQVAAGVPLQCDEGADYRSFRIGLFGLDKLGDVDGTVARVEAALDAVG